jgi:hypothetical protein
LRANELDSRVALAEPVTFEARFVVGPNLLVHPVEASA